MVDPRGVGLPRGQNPPAKSISCLWSLASYGSNYSGIVGDWSLETGMGIDLAAFVDPGNVAGISLGFGET